MTNLHEGWAWPETDATPQGRELLVLAAKIALGASACVVGWSIMIPATLAQAGWRLTWHYAKKLMP